MRSSETMAAECIVCGSTDWIALPDPHPEQSVRTDGTIERSPLGKLQCSRCGLAHRPPLVDVEAMYTDDYALYSNRPGADAFTGGRHPEVAGRIAKLVPDLRPKRILEVGCGDGATLHEMRAHWPDAKLAGIEPSLSASETACQAGLDVTRGLIGPSGPGAPGDRYDLVYSVQVIEHTEDPSQFLRAQASLLSPDGVVVVVCPNGATPHAEIIHSDHLFSLLPSHVTRLAKAAGLEVNNVVEFVLEGAREYNQIVVARRGGNELAEQRAAPDAGELEELRKARQDYLTRWARFESHLTDQMIGAKTFLPIRDRPSSVFPGM